MGDDFLKKMFMTGSNSNDVSNEETNDAVQEIVLSDIHPDPNQPRKEIDEEELAGLAASIKDQGLIQPIIVYRNGTGYIIVAGERRYQAHNRLEKSTIKSIVIDEPDAHKKSVLQLIENIQRSDLSAFEQADGISALVSEGIKQHEISKSLGLDKSMVSQLLFISKATEEERKRYKGLGVRRIYDAMRKVEPEQKTDLTKKQIDIAINTVLERAKKDQGYLIKLIGKEKIRKIIQEIESQD